ncbi:MAG: hypothetical protein IT480_04550 [Gammaproteobacteria bacterium]|nr:hypothetical protein [Gammaproteobacteria bacterium]
MDVMLREHGSVFRAAKMLVTAAILCLSSPIYANNELVRVTTSFDVRHVGAVLRQVSKLLDSGFQRPQADQLAREIDALKADEPRVWDFQVTWQGGARPLRIRALLDDLGNVDLDFSTTPDLAPHIRRSVDGYLNTRGL